MDYMKEFVDLYVDAESTATNYCVAIKQYAKWCEETKGWDMQDIVDKADKRTSIQFLNYLTTTGISPISVNTKHSALESFFKYLCELDYRDNNPFENVKRQNTKMIEQKVEYVTYDEYKLLLKTINTKAPRSKNFEFTSARDNFMIITMFTCGLRISEVMNMKFRDIDWSTNTIKIIGKGSKFRRVPFTEAMEEAFYNYVEVRGEYTDDDYVFVSVTGSQMNNKDCNKNLAKYCKRANIDKDITNHSLRHGSCSYYLQQGVPVAKVSSLLGHENLATTSRYTHMSTQDLDFAELVK